MGFEFNIYSVILLASGIFTAILSTLILRKRGALLRWFGFLILAISIWAHTYALELASRTLDQMMFFIRFEYLAMAPLPVFWIIFVFRYIGRSNWLDSTRYALLFVIPLITVLLVWTNDLHHLHYASVGVDSSGAFPLLDLKAGIWYKINTAYFYLLLGAGLILLIVKLRKSESIYRRQNLTLIVGAAFPAIVNIFYLFDLRPLGHVDLTPYAFSLTAFSVAFGILRFKLFELLPVARDKVLEVMQDGVLVLDRKNRVVFVNKTMKKFLDVPVMGLRGTEIDFLFPHDDKLITAIKNGIQTAVELKVKKGVEIKYFEVLITPIFERNQTFSGQLLLFRDETDRKLYSDRLQTQTDELIALNNLKDKLFSIIAHDLQGPMGSLRDLLAMAGAGDLSDDEVRRLLPHAASYVNNISELMENLLHWSRSQISRIEVNKENIRLINLVTGVVNLFEKKAAEKQITINANIDRNVQVCADKDMLQFVIRNLLANAIKFCNPNDTISISCTVADELITIMVCDTGVGIKEENIGKLFGLENFSTRGTKSEKGTGLGLLLCKEFVEKNGGTIWVESKWEKGSTFSFTIPAVLEPAEFAKK